MMYNITNTDGELVATIADATINTSLPITLFGRLYQNWGQTLNNDLVRMMENFSCATAPSSPITGQLWYNHATATLSLYDNATSPQWSQIVTLGQVNTQLATLQGQINTQLTAFQGQVNSQITTLQTSVGFSLSNPLTTDQIQNLITAGNFVTRSGDTMTGNLVLGTAYSGNNSTPSLVVQSGSANISFIVSNTTGSLSPIVQAGDSLISFTTGAINTGALTIAPYGAGTAGGMRMDNTGATTFSLPVSAPTVAQNSNNNIIATTAFVIGQAASVLPLVDGSIASIGTSYQYARQDHVHPFHAHGQCRLTAPNSLSLLLSPYGGCGITIDGVTYAIPSVGVSISNTGLSSLTLYYVYVYNNGNNLALELSTTTHANDYGIEIKTGDASRTLVGMVFTNASSQFIDTAAVRNVATYFNRRGLSLNGTQVSVGITATSYVALGSSANCEFVCWSDESIMINVGGTAQNNTASATVSLILAVDGVTNQGNGSTTTSPYANQSFAILFMSSSQMSEDHHSLSPMGRVSSGTANFIGAITAYFRG